MIGNYHFNNLQIYFVILFIHFETKLINNRLKKYCNYFKISVKLFLKFMT